MTTPSDPENGQSPPDAVNLGKADPPASSDPAGEAPFDPYRFGKPDHPIPAEYAPPGYTGPIAPPPNPYAGGPHAGTAPPPGSTTSNPFGNPPGTPYAPGPQAPSPGGPQAPYPGGPPAPYGPPAGPPYGPQYGPQYGQPHGQPYNQPYGYGPQPPHYSQPTGNNGKAVAALVLGILSVVLCWLSVFDAVFVILALIFGLIALGETKNGRGRGRGLAIAGLACMVVGALLATIISIKVFRAIDRCGGFDQANQSSFNQCVKDNV